MKFINLIKTFVLSSLALLIVEACSDIHALEKREGLRNAGLTLVEWNQLPGWKVDELQGALAAFKNSLSELIKNDSDKWTAINQAINFVDEVDKASVRGFFEKYFAAFKLKQSLRITSFCKQKAEARLQKEDSFIHPIYKFEGEKNQIPTGFRQEFLNDPSFHLAYYSNPIEGFLAEFQGNASLMIGKDLMKADVIGSNNTNREEGSKVEFKSIGKFLKEYPQSPLPVSTEDFNTRFIRWGEQYPNLASMFVNKYNNGKVNFFCDLKGDPNDEELKGIDDIFLSPYRSIAIDPILGENISSHGICFISTTDPLTNQPLNRMVFNQAKGLTSLGGEARINIYANNPSWASQMNSKVSSIYVILPK